jgi:E3 ubiquitin-protein ligase makorin
MRGEGVCPFGISCFYKHSYKDGSLDERKVRVVTGSEEEGVVLGAVQLSDFFRD